MEINTLLPNFNAGELSPLMQFRSDIKKYKSGCFDLKNFKITSQETLMLSFLTRHSQQILL